MTSAAVEAQGGRPDGAGVALAGYILLSLSVFAAGVPALVAVALAYWRRDRSVPALRDHFSRQIVIFWIAVLLIVIALALAVAAIVTAAGSLVHVGVHHDWTTVSLDASRLVFFDSDLGRLGLSTPVAGLAIGSIVAWAVSGLWLFIAPIFGAIALARSPLMGETRR